MSVIIKNCIKETGSDGEKSQKNAIKPPFFCVQYLYFYNRKKLLLCNQYEDFIIFLKIDMKNHNSFSKNCCIFLQLCVKCI